MKPAISNVPARLGRTLTCWAALFLTAAVVQADPIPVTTIGFGAAGSSGPDAGVASPDRTANGGQTQHLDSPDQTPQGLAKSDWQSIRAAYEAGRHAFAPLAGMDGHWQARNPGQQWTTKFDRRGFLTQPREGAWQWGLVLESYGRGGEPTRVSGEPAVQAEGQRLTYQWDATVQEWWVNDTRGLEHGYTLAQRPAGNGDALELTLGTRGTLVPKVSDDARGVLFCDGSGATVVNYTGLKVWDADGQALASRFEPAGAGRVRLRVEDRAARYPLTIDPIAQQAYLKASQVNGGDEFGRSVAVSGDTVVVGAYLEDSSTTGSNSTPDELAGSAGAAYVFTGLGPVGNAPPVAGADPLNRPNTTRVAKVLTSTLLGNDSDTDLDPLTLTAVGSALPAGATVVIAGNFVVYTAPANNAGHGSFEYTLSDGPGGHTGTGTVTVTETGSATGNGTPNSLAIQSVGDDFLVTFLGVPGLGYRVQYTTDTVPPHVWNEFAPPATYTAGSNGVFTHTDVNPPGPVRFYRAAGE